LESVRAELEKNHVDQVEKEESHHIEAEALRTENAALEDQLSDAQQSLQSQQQERQRLEAELDKLNAELVRLNQIQAQGQSSEQALEAASREIADLKKTVDDLREVQLEMETQLSADSEEEIVRLKAALEQEAVKRRTAEGRAQQADFLRRERDVQEAAVEMLGEDLEKLGNEKQQLEAEKKALEERLSSMMDQGAGLGTDTGQGLGESAQRPADLENERDAARAEAARLNGEVQELRGVMQTYADQIQRLQSSEQSDALAAMRSELEMVRRQAAEDLAKMRAKMADSAAQDGPRDIEDAATLQALRQEMDSIRHALREKDQLLGLSQTQCRTLEDSIEDRDREVDQLKQKLELLLRKTGGLGEFTETLGAENATSQILPDDTHQITDVLQDMRVPGQVGRDDDNKGHNLGRLFRRK
jgi:chromosome segregation ATPase